MRKDFLIFGRPYLGPEEIEAACDCLRKAWIGTGPKVQIFEQKFAQYKKTPYAAALNSCTAALHLSCRALGIGPGDEVITTAMTFCATVNAIIYTGATPVLVDIDPHSLNIDPEKIQAKITPRTKAIIVVHFAGRPCDMEKILGLAKRNNLFLIEDCAHSIESTYKGQQTGTFGDAGCFSFYATKNITSGEGGMVISRNASLIQNIKLLSQHGLDADAWNRFSHKGYRHYRVTQLGFKYNMMDLQAAIGIQQLKKIESFWKRRKEIWDRYMRELNPLPLTLPASVTPDTKHAFHLFTIRIHEKTGGVSRDEFIRELTKRKIGVGVHYLSIPEHPFYKDHFGWEPEDFPHALQFGRETVSLPLSPKMTNQDVNDVINSVCEILL